MQVSRAMIAINRHGLKGLIDRISKSSDELAKSFISQEVLESLKMLASISEQLRNHIRVFATDTIIQGALSLSEDNYCEIITWDDLETHDIYLQVEQKRLGQWNRVIAMIITQLVRSLESRPEKHTPEGEKLKPVLLLLDEFPQLGKIEVLANALATLRSKKITFILFCQSLADLEAIYGEATARRINDNCAYKVVLDANDLKTQQYFSALVGTKKTTTKGISVPYNYAAGVAVGANLNFTESSEPVILPHEFASLQGAILLHPEGFSRIINIAHHTPGHPKNPENYYNR